MLTFLKVYIELMEKVRIRMVRMVSGLKGRNYQEELKELGLETLETRRRRYNLIQTFKILRGFIVWIAVFGLKLLGMSFQDNLLII